MMRNGDTAYFKRNDGTFLKVTIKGSTGLQPTYVVDHGSTTWEVSSGELVPESIYNSPLFKKLHEIDEDKK